MWDDPGFNRRSATAVFVAGIDRGLKTTATINGRSATSECAD